jgi:hypothetical protein
MTTYLEYLSFKSGLKWYKRLFIPLFLNDKEYEEYLRIATGEQSDLDYARDMCYLSLQKWQESDTYYNKKDFEFWKSVVEMLMRQEYENNR